MYYKILMLFVSISFLSCTSLSESTNQTTLCKVDLHIANTSIKYEIKNVSNKTIFIAKSYFLCYDDFGNTVFESYYKSPLINYNDFNAPELISIDQKVILKGETSSSQVIGDDIYFRIYDLHYLELYNFRVGKSIGEIDFLDYEKEHSFLVKAFVK